MARNDQMLTSAAQVLEKVADYFDAVEREKEAELQEARERVVEDLKAQIRETSGTDPEEEIISKLAQADDSVLEAVKSILKPSGNLEEMGEPGGSTKTASEDLTPEEEAEITEQRLIEFCEMGS